MSEPTNKGTPLWSDQDRTGWYQNAFDWFVKGAQTVDSAISSSTTKDKYGFTNNTVVVGSVSYKLGVTRDFHDRFQMRDPVSGETRFKCEMPETQEEALASGAKFAKFAATEAMAGASVNPARKEIEKRVLAVMDRLDPSGDNTTRWRNFFDSLDEKGFGRFMQLLKDKKVAMNIVMPNMQKVLKISDILNAAKYVGLKTSHRLWMPDLTRPGKKYLTPEKYLILELPIRRAEEAVDKKMSVPSRDRRTDALTGQVIADDKACSISAPEIQALHVRGLHNTLSELVRVRGGDVNAYGDYNRQLQEHGSASLASLDSRTRAKSAVMTRILLQAMGIDNNM